MALDPNPTDRVVDWCAVQAEADGGPGSTPGAVVVIGNFDGVHRGHAEVIRTARALDPTARLVAVTFSPHPMSVIRPDQAPLVLTTPQRRAELLRRVGVDEVVVVPFTPEVAGWSPERFVAEVLEPLRPVAVVVGENFRFGFRAAGTPTTLAELGAGRWTVHALPLVTVDDRPDSSTLLREAVLAGELDRFRQLAGHEYQFGGVVVRGDQRGREMGFPTANVPVPAGMAVPADGVYAGWVTRLDRPDAPHWPAAISVGTNPTFDGVERRVEAYVLDRDDLELYGVEIAVVFVARLRGQVKYEGMPALIAQMHRDVAEIRVILGQA